MRAKTWAASWLVLFGSAHAAEPRKRDYDAHDYYAIHLSPDVDVREAEAQLGLHYEGKLGELADHHVFRSEERQHGYDHIKSQKADLRRRRRKREAGANAPHVLDSVLLSKKQELHKRFPLVKREPLPVPQPIGPQPRQDLPVDWAVQKGLDIAEQLGIKDPIFQDQWHLWNHVQVGHDINVTGVWQQGITGKNNTVCIVDDGLDMDSNDLRDNYFAEGSWDYNDPGPDPKPRLSDDRHGTRCAGEIAAVRNDVCGVGIAYDGKVSGARILSKVISDADEAEAMNIKYHDNHIYSCSWGPPDDGKSMEAPGILIQRAMVNGVQRGRNGLGSIYVFAIGNGAANDDNCNFDGYTNSIYSVSVGGIDRKGLHPYYSEKCSAQLVVTYSSGSGDAIHTTDVGQNKCYNNHGGTSAAGPLVAGMYALMLEANPNLTWRDIQWITVLTAVKIDQESDWTMNEAVKKEFSHQFGYGKADAWALVERAKNWTSVKPQAWYYSPWMHVKHEIPQGDIGLASIFEVTAEMLKEANLERLEHVTVTMNVEHTRRGDLSVDLHSPSGMISEIATHRRNDAAAAGYVDWTFMSVAHWGESGVGNWTVIVKDTNVNEHTGTFTDWRLRLWGESIDPATQTLLPLPEEDDDDDHDIYHEPGVATTSVSVPTETGSPQGNPSDHPDRPTKPKPTPTTAIPSVEASVTGLPTGTEEDKVDEKPSASSSAAAASSTSTTTQEHLLPHIFPTFGVTRTTQIWIYGSILLIAFFLSGLAIWYWRQKRRRRWMAPRDSDYEMVDHDDDGGDAGRGLINGAANVRGKASKLYDAFAPGSDDEADDFDLGEDSEEEDRFGERGEHEGYEGKGGHERYRDDAPLREGTDVDG
ncbi:pheromone processing endoprotease kex2 like protein [Teratosphaeria destructans]|uniref:Pheromone processing endoprotease kex2 like protein n=1 Tax=Teratosphaeria destructans TaxID=418781 RepID=A0A9W7SI98_9PEZI|nr:pheromone processing endoprotease kex2 like protein [Teratosphaeria destructans]